MSSAAALNHQDEEGQSSARRSAAKPPERRGASSRQSKPDLKPRAHRVFAAGEGDPGEAQRPDPQTRQEPQVGWPHRTARMQIGKEEQPENKEWDSDREPRVEAEHDKKSGDGPYKESEVTIVLTLHTGQSRCGSRFRQAVLRTKSA
jgi:hypothetical protein